MTVHIHLDLVVGDILRGWAVDDEAPDTPVVVEVHAGQEPLGSIVADQERRDLTSGENPTPRAGFRFKLPASLLTGGEQDFSVRAVAGEYVRANVTRTLATTRLAYATASEKPWVESVDNTGSPISVDSPDVVVALRKFEEGRIDEAIGHARKTFRTNRDLFVVDTGIVDAVSRHVGIKTFEQLMADRRHDWFDADNHSLWQSRLEKKTAMHALARRNLVQIPRQIAKFADPADLLKLDLPSRYVVKPDGLASAKGVFAVSSGVNVFTGKSITRERIVANWVALASETDRIDEYIVEEFVADRFAPEATVIPLDFKFYVFRGVAGFLEVFDRNYPSPSRTPYSISWQPLPEPLDGRHTLGAAMRLPDNLDELIDAAERVGQDVGAFCRVDLFNSPSGPLLGEITTLPANGKTRSAYANRILQQAYIVFEDQQLWAMDS